MQKIGEIFNEARMTKCTRIHRQIMDDWQRNRVLSYKVRCAENLDGKTLEQLSKLYFSVGVKNDLTDLPLLDMLVVFSLIAAEVQGRTDHKGESEFTLKLQAKTFFTEDEVFSMLDQIAIEMPPLVSPGG